MKTRKLLPRLTAWLLTFAVLTGTMLFTLGSDFDDEEIDEEITVIASVDNLPLDDELDETQTEQESEIIDTQKNNGEGDSEEKTDSTGEDENVDVIFDKKYYNYRIKKTLIIGNNTVNCHFIVLNKFCGDGDSMKFLEKQLDDINTFDPIFVCQHYDFDLGLRDSWWSLEKRNQFIETLFTRKCASNELRNIVAIFTGHLHTYAYDTYTYWHSYNSNDGKSETTECVNRRCLLVTTGAGSIMTEEDTYMCCHVIV